MFYKTHFFCTLFPLCCLSDAEKNINLKRTQHHTIFWFLWKRKELQQQDLLCIAMLLLKMIILMILWQ